MSNTYWRSNARRLVRGVLPLILASPVFEANEVSAAPPLKNEQRAENSDRPNVRSSHLNVDNTIGDLLSHPAFRGFASRILPWDDRSYDSAMPLKSIAQLLPYHTHVNAAVMVSSINRLIDDIAQGNQVFYDIYTDEKKRNDPALKNTGLFFFRGDPNAPFAMVAPGGGFAYVGSVHEGFPYGTEINAKKLNAFVLKYRVGSGGRVANEDLAAALTFIFNNADRLQVSTKNYSLWGSSAGARMAASIGSHGTRAYGGADVPSPSAVVMAYTAHSDVSAKEPPTFVVVGENDGIAPPASMESRIAQLKRIHTLVEYHKYPAIAHGFGAGQSTSAEGWIDKAIQFWKSQIKESR